MAIRIATIRLSKGIIAALLLLMLGGGVLLYQSWASGRPHATATLTAGPMVPGVSGSVHFRNEKERVKITVSIDGLPPYDAGPPPTGPHGFHIHEGSGCEIGDPADPFQAAGGHWNPDGQPHGNHAGDFPVLFSKRGRARLTFYSDRFTADEIVGRTVIVHLNPDDYRTQPAGDSGMRIACGVIVPYGQ